MNQISSVLRTSGNKTNNNYVYWRVSDFQKMSFVDKFISQKIERR